MEDTWETGKKEHVHISVAKTISVLFPPPANTGRQFSASFSDRTGTCDNIQVNGIWAK